MGEAKKSENTEVSSVKKEEQIVQRIVELLNERGYEYERDARPIIYWKYDVKSSRELTLEQKQEVLQSLEEGTFEQWGLEYRDKVLNKQMDIVKEIEKMHGAPGKIQIDSERNVAIATDEQEVDDQTAQPSSESDATAKESTKDANTDTGNQASKMKIDLNKPAKTQDDKTQKEPAAKQDDTAQEQPAQKIVLAAKTASDSTDSVDQDNTQEDNVRLLPKKEQTEDTPEKKKLLKPTAITLEPVKPKKADESDDTAEKKSDEKQNTNDPAAKPKIDIKPAALKKEEPAPKSIDLSLPSKDKEPVAEKSEAKKPEPTSNAAEILSQMTGASDAGPKTHIAPSPQDIVQKEATPQTDEQQEVQQPVDVQPEQPEPAAEVPEEKPQSAVEIPDVQEEVVEKKSKRKRVLKAKKSDTRHFSKKDRLSNRTDGETPVGMELSEAERIVRNKFNEEIEQEPVTIGSVALVGLSLVFLGVSLYTNAILLMNQDIPAWLESICRVFM